MVDPVSIVAGVVSVSAACMKGLQTASQYVMKYNLAELKFLALTTECSTLHLSLLEIQRRLLRNDVGPQIERQLGPAKATFESVLGRCSTIFAILNERLQDLITPACSSDNRPAVKSKIAAVWNESEIDQLQNLIRGQVQCVQLLITAFQMGSIFTTAEFLSSDKAVSILQKAESDTQSLCITHPLRSLNDPTAEASSSLGSGVQVEDNFFQHLAQSKAYQRAYIYTLRGSESDSEPLRHEPPNSRCVVETVESTDYTFHTAQTEQGTRNPEPLRQACGKEPSSDNMERMDVDRHQHLMALNVAAPMATTESTPIDPTPQNVRVMRTMLEKQRAFNSQVDPTPLEIGTWGEAIQCIRRQDCDRTTAILRSPKIHEISTKDFDSLIPREKRTKRLLREYRDYGTESFLSFHFLADDLSSIRSTIEGPPSSPYSGGIFHFLLRIPERYPFAPPECSCLTRIYHPNINTQGEVCIDILNAGWSPVFNLSTLMLSILSLLSDPTADDPLVPEIAVTYLENKEEYNRIAREMTQRYATPQQDMPEFGIMPLAR